MVSERPTIRPAILLLVAAVLSAVVFLPSLSGDWIFDDRPLIAANPYVHSFAGWTRWFTTDFWDVNAEMARNSHRIIYWRPAISATYALDWTISAGAPAFFHLINLVWQAVMGALAFHVLKRWIGAAIPALVVAVLFAIHPTKAESVAWIAGRTDVLCMVCVLIATQGMARRRRGARGGLALEIVGTIAAYLCKEQAIVLPVFAMVEAWVSLDRPPLDRPTLRALIVAAIPQGVLAVAYLAIRMAVLPIGAAGSIGTLSMSAHAWAVLETYGRFTTLMVAPHEMSIQQGFMHSAGALHGLSFHRILGAITIVGLAALIIGLRRRRPEISVGLGFYVLTLLPTSNLKFTQMHTLVSERFLYLPSLGIALLAGIALARATPIWRRRGYALALAIGLGFAAVSFSHSADFQDEEQFWGRELALHPDSGPAQEFAIESAIQRMAYREALALLIGPRVTTDDFNHDASDELLHAVLAARVSAHLTPDHDKVRLQNIDAFCVTLLTRNKPRAVLALLGGELTIDTTGLAYPNAQHEVEPNLFALHTELVSRLGDDARAVAAAEQAIASCATCLATVTSAMVALAAAGTYDRADAVLAGARGRVDEAAFAQLSARLKAAHTAHSAAAGIDPDALRARATELSSLELWGRAYDVFVPYLGELEHAPRVAVGVAELAFRAGEPAVARRLLITAAPLNDADATLAGWAASMGWQ